MHLCAANNEAAYLWLKEQTESMSEPPPANDLTWRISTTELYQLLCKHLRSLGLEVITIEDLWGIIQISFPKVKIIGPAGNRAFTELRRSYPPSQKDLEWLSRNKQAEENWQQKWAKR